MIRHHVQKSAADAIRYYQLADYLAEGQEVRPELGGKAAELLGVSGSNAKEHFERLCHNLHPLTGAQLTERMRGDRICGIDVTFDVPKIWSVLEQLTPEGPALAEARRRASRETMEEMERAAAVRMRKAGRDDNHTSANLVWYRAEHDTTRPVDGVPDMASHEHYFVLNASYCDRDRQWKAANLYDILRDMPYYQAAFHQRLARGAAELGFDVKRQGKWFFDLDGFPRSITDKFSRRTAEIEAEAKERGVTDPKEKAQLGAKTRQKKCKALSASQLRRIWAGCLSKPEREAILAGHWKAKQRQAGGHEPPRGDAAAAMEHAADHVFERKSSVPARELLAHALAYGVGGFDVEEAWRHLENADRFTAEVDGRLHVASRKVLAEEERLVKLARAGRGELPAIDPEWEIKNTRLEIDQRAAVHHLLGSRDFVTMVIGDAGVGKTTLLKEAKQGAEASGLRVMAFAPSAAASRTNLRVEGFPDAETTARLLVDRKLQERARGQVLLIDEAALMGTKETAELLALAHELDARVWLVGDDKQHRAVNRGAPFDLLQKSAGVQPARVRKLRRQRTRSYKQVVELARDKPHAAVKRLADMGWLKEVPDAERYQLLAADYLEAVKPERRKVRGHWEEVTPSALVVAPTHAEGAKVTAAIRSGLAAQGKLGEEREFLKLANKHLTEAERRDPHSYEAGDVLQFMQNARGHRRGERVALTEGQVPPVQHAARFQAYRPGTIRLAVGDRVRVTAGGKTKDGKRLDNGELLTVAGFTKGGDWIDDKGRVIDRDFGHLAHGYVTTSHGGQSRTVERVLVALGQESLAAANRRELYVDLSRGRQWARLYTHSAEDVARAARRDDAQVSATELLKRRKEQRREAGLFAHRLLLSRRQATERAPQPHVIDTDRQRELQRGRHL